MKIYENLEMTIYHIKIGKTWSYIKLENNNDKRI